MSVQWFTKGLQALATIYDNNITFNTAASRFLDNAYKVLIGFDQKEKTLLFKTISKEDIALGLYKTEDLHSVTIKPSYGRIHSKHLIRNLTEFFPLDFEKKIFYKYECTWDATQKTLKVNLEKEVEE